MLKKAINHVIQEKRKDKNFKEKGVWILAKKLHPYPLHLKSKVWNQGEEDGGYEHYLVFLEKREESRSFDVFLCFSLERNMVRKERENAQKCPKQL